jgi:hypothetical protein
LGFWQVIVRRESVKLGGNLEDINNFAEVQKTKCIFIFKPKIKPQHVVPI